MNISNLENRITKLEKLVSYKRRMNESVEDARSEISDILANWLNDDRFGVKHLRRLRKAIVDADHYSSEYVDLVDEIKANEADAYSTFVDQVDDEDEFACDELDDMIIDVIDELV